MQAELGDLDRVEVIDGCSDVLVEVLGKRGRGARCAVGMAELPIGIAVEIEAVVQVR
jgi:enamine deaminase RidA (YjgF/YER057c/UK114 family)